jgi:hypothetical protein
MGYSDDMMGLAMYDDMGAFMSGSQLKEHLMAGGAGGIGILATSAVLQRVPFPADWQPSTTSKVKNLLALGVGVIGGRMMYDRNREAALGFMGGVGGLAIAQLLQSFAPETLSTSLSGGGLSSADLAALESAVATNSPSWRAGAGMSAPSVSERQLASTGTTQEELADYDRYMGASNAYAPSF